MSQWLHTHIEPGSLVEAAAPRGDFYLTEGTDPVILISAGIGITPVLAMLHALSAARSAREIWWLHTTRNRETQAFADEVTALIESLPHARQSIFFTQTRGRLDSSAIAALGLPPDAAAYLCGPTQFMTDMRDSLNAAGLDNAQYSQRIVRRVAANQSWDCRRGATPAAAPSGRNTGNGTVNHLCPQRTYRQLV